MLLLKYHHELTCITAEHITTYTHAVFQNISHCIYTSIRITISPHKSIHFYTNHASNPFLDCNTNHHPFHYITTLTQSTTLTHKLLYNSPPHKAQHHATRTWHRRCRLRCHITTSQWSVPTSQITSDTYACH